MSSIERIESRLNRLERECRWWRRVFITAVIVGGTTLMMGGAARDQVPKRIEAESFVLKDSTGELRAVLGTWPRSQATYLRFFDEHGRRIDMGTEAGYAMIKMFGEGRQQRIRLTAPLRGDGSFLVNGRERDAFLELLRLNEDEE